ncbi:hypothetical protein FPV67DRAFT_1561141 [Lyophyllum atratum]|nr:hypothetical protein FPV67DRAFT_1561141 [Lyophyllum atratum]
MGDPSEDGQLTIRIPNPKVYMARQSLWIGRRGKPRCDHCRLNNLKARKLQLCDRVLPACNHCSWTAGRECKYTPLPTPAHRGIPRCDRCRLNNLKCDRNLPVCNHCKEEKKTECNYTPKKRRKNPSESMHSSTKQDPSRKTEASLAGRGEIKRTQLVPWNNPSFAPLPEFITRGIKSLNSTELPDSAVFNESLAVFLEGVMPELRETSCLAPENYTALYRCLSRGDTAKLSPRMREWASCHHLCPGSDRSHLILVPRESIFQAEESMRETYRRTYCARVDGGSKEERESTPGMYAPETMEDAQLFERLPVRDQVFDILTYAHISHDNSYAMILGIRKLGFASITWPMAEIYTRLCPTCNLRDRQGESHSAHGEGEVQ